MSASRRQTDTDTDVLKLLAALFVVMIHTASNFSGHLFWGALARFSVPVFVLISGHYMLSRQSYFSSIWKRCLHILVVMICWSALFLVYDVLTLQSFPQNFTACVKYLLTQPVHLWYCYAIFALYLFTPVFLAFCRNASRQELEYGLGLTFFFGSIVVILLRSECFPTLNTVVDKMKLDCTLGFVFLYLAGYYLRVYPLSSLHRRLLYLLGILGFVITYLGTAWLSHGSEGPNDLLYSFFAPNVIVTSLAVYVWIRYRHQKHPFRDSSGWLHRLSVCTPGIYFLHPMVILSFQRFAPWPDFPGTIPLQTIAVFVISCGIVLLFQNIPVVKKLVS